MPRSINQVVNKADETIMDLCAPEKMTPAEAKDFLEQVIERCHSAIEALIEENEELRE
jgi:hypothetical protein